MLKQVVLQPLAKETLAEQETETKVPPVVVLEQAEMAAHQQFQVEVAMVAHQLLTLLLVLLLIMQVVAVAVVLVQHQLVEERERAMVALVQMVNQQR